MDKKSLRSIERPVAAEELIRLAERSDNTKYIVTSKIIDVSGNKILLLNFFLRRNLVKKETGAEFRTFLSRSDYITQDLTTTRTKWKTGCFNSLLEWWMYGGKRRNSVIWASDTDYVSARYYMKSYLKDGETDVWEAIVRFQDEVIESRLDARRKKETDVIDTKMDTVPEIPEDFGVWCHDEAMADKRYLIYKYAGGKKSTVGYCTWCRKLVEIDNAKIRPRHRKKGICPSCGSLVTFLANGKFQSSEIDYKWVCLIQKVQNGIVARYFRISQRIWSGTYKEDFSYMELARAFFEEDSQSIDSYIWGVYKQRGNSRWCPDQGQGGRDFYNAVLYTKNLPESYAGTRYQYCAMDIYQNKSGCDPIPIWKYMKEYPRNKYLEMFIKAGLVKLTGQIVESYSRIVNESGRTPVEILEIPKNYIAILRQLNGGSGELKLLKQCYADRILCTAQEIKEFYARFGGNDELIGVVNTHMTLGKFIRYMDRQREKIPEEPVMGGCHCGYITYRRKTKEQKISEQYRNLSHDWLDYIRWCALLNYDINDIHVLLPSDFKKHHDRVMKEYEDYESMKAKERMKILDRRVKGIIEQMRASRSLKMKSGGLMIVLPKNAEEIRREGRTLNHCVGNYVERVAKGQTLILFVRKESDPETPYFTLEYRNNHVVQCRGKFNCAMPNEVESFVKAFERKMQEENRKQERRAG